MYFCDREIQEVQNRAVGNDKDSASQNLFLHVIQRLTILTMSKVMKTRETANIPEQNLR